MFKYLFSLILFCSTGLFAFAENACDTEDAYNIKITIEGYESEAKVKLGYHYGAKQYLTDSMALDNKGTAVFKGDAPLKGGIYFIVVPEHGYFEFIMQEGNMSLETKLDDYVNSMKVKGSKENELYYDYLQFIGEQKKKANALKEKIAATSDEKEMTKLKEESKKLDKEVKHYRRTLEKHQPDSFVPKFLKSYDEPKVPEPPKDENGKIDSSFQFKYYKAHFWDNIDLADDRMARTPVLDKKLTQYMDKMVHQLPDSLEIAADYLLAKAKPGGEVFKWMTTLLLNKYAKSKIMGHDAIYVHLVDQYFASGQATWVDSVQLYKIKDRADMIRPNLIGKKAPPLRLKDQFGEWHDIYKMEEEYVVLYFWDPDCGHCKKSTPVVHDFYNDYKDKNIKVIGITTEHEEDKWLEYIEKNKLEWLNLGDLKYRNNFRRLYDISGTPRIFILDKDRTIIGKRIGADQLQDFMDRVLASKEKEDK